MIDPVATYFEKDKVALFEFISFHGLCFTKDILSPAAHKPFFINLLVSLNDKAAAVNSFFGIATHAVRGASPVINEGAQGNAFVIHQFHPVGCLPGRIGSSNQFMFKVRLRTAFGGRS